MALTHASRLGFGARRAHVPAVAFSRFYVRSSSSIVSVNPARMGDETVEPEIADMAKELEAFKLRDVPYDKKEIIDPSCPSVPKHAGPRWQALSTALDVDGMSKSTKALADEWSQAEDDTMMELIRGCNFKISQRYIAWRMGRSLTSVRMRLKKLLTKTTRTKSSRTASLRFWESEVSGPEQAVLEERMCKIITGLFQEFSTVSLEMRKTMDFCNRQFFLETIRAFRTRTPEQWTATLLPMIPRRIKHLLAAPRSPTTADWRAVKELETECTAALGVFMDVRQPDRSKKLLNRSFLDAKGPIGSVLCNQGISMGFGSCLITPDTLLRRDPYVRGPTRPMARIALLIICKTVDPSESEYEPPKEPSIETKRLLAFSEAVLATWLGARVRGEAGQTLLPLCPWEPKDIIRYGLLWRF